MTATLPQEARDAFRRFITCEYTTVDARQQPITWPVTPYYTDGAPTVDVTTGLGYPKKADDARRNPHVSLLFSDPTGSGIESGITVLVQGTAAVDEADLEANRERYFRESWDKLPGIRGLHPPKPIRGLFNWYYTRIYVHVRPERVFIWPDGDHSREPQLMDSRLEEVRSGQSEEPLDPHVPPTGGAVPWDARIGQLGSRHTSAVLSWVAPDGFPLSVRVRPEPNAVQSRILLGPGPAGLPIAEGCACLTAHAHGPQFEWQENFQVRGDLVPDDEGWALVPRKLVGGFELPDESLLARYRRNLAKSVRFYRAARRRVKARSS
jgi:hypothetical protein